MPQSGHEGSAQAPGSDNANSAKNFLDRLEKYVAAPTPAADAPFLMPIEDVFSIAGRGTVVTGRVEQGSIEVGEEVEIVGLRDTRSAVVTGVEMFRKLLDRAEAGDDVGCLLAGLARDDVQRGQVLAQPGSIRAHQRFEAQVYLLTKDEGGRHTPPGAGYAPQFYFRTTDVTGRVDLPAGDLLMPGATADISAELGTPVAMDEGLTFAIREGGRTVGVGVVTAVHPASGAPASVPGKQPYDVILRSYGDQKIAVIKEVRAARGMGLKEAKDLVESAPTPLLQGVSQEKALEIERRIEAAGGEADVERSRPRSGGSES